MWFIFSISNQITLLVIKKEYTELDITLKHIDF